MIQLESDIISVDLSQKLKNLEIEIEEFRKFPLDSLALEKLREHFRTHHIYHSTGIEGNRLTLQETSIVLKEGIDISGKPLKDSIEVKNLGLAFDFLYELSNKEVPITENYIKQVHQIIVGNDAKLSPGNYRDIGVIITGSEHTPPEPFEVPIRMQELFTWINENIEKNPIMVAAIAHHEFVKIHPFKDGNGRTARILLNLILLKYGYPICNIKREQRPSYYEALSIADTGEYEPIIELVASNTIVLFAEYTRVKDETNRMKEWAKSLGNKDIQRRLAKKKTEFELWTNKVNQIKLEFKQAVNILDENFESYYISFYEYQSITFEKYQSLQTKGIAPATNFFSIRIHDNETNRILETFMFRFYRSNNKYSNENVIPLELNYFDKSRDDFNFIGYHDLSDKIHLRAIYINEKGEIIKRYCDPNNRNPNWELEDKVDNVTSIVMEFFDNVFKHRFGIR